MLRRGAQLGFIFLFAASLTACGGAAGSLPADRSALSKDAKVLPTSSLVSRAASLTAKAQASSIAVDAGGAVAGSWMGDSYYSMVGSSGVKVVSKSIDVSGVVNPAPQAVYQSQRYSTHLTYSIPNLAPGTNYNVRLHFVESFWDKAGQRVFSAKINGIQVLTGFDIFKSAGGANIAIVRQFTASPDTTGSIRVVLDASENNASIAGIEVTPVLASPSPSPSATPSPTPTGYADANLPPAGWQFPYSPNPFTVAACSIDPCSPSLDANSAAEVRSLMDTASGVAGGLDLGDIYEGYSADNDQPVYYASASDPLYSVSCEGGCGSGSPVRVRIPNGAYASSGSDHHLIVVDLSSGTETDFYEFNDHGTGTGTTIAVSGGGALTAGSAGVCTITSFAGNANSCANSATGALLPLRPMMLDPREVMNGAINHTLYVAVGCAQSSYVYPAGHADGLCGTAGPKYGQRVWLDLSDAQIDAITGNSTWATNMLHAMHHYGWTIGDNNGGGKGIGFAIVAPGSFTLWGIANPWEAFWSAAAPGSNFITIPKTGISPSNIHILAPCVNTQNC